MAEGPMTAAWRERLRYDVDARRRVQGDVPPRDQMAKRQGRCVYCGARTKGRDACRGHSDLQALDPSRQA